MGGSTQYAETNGLDMVDTRYDKNETNGLDIPEGGLDRLSLVFFYR